MRTLLCMTLLCASIFVPCGNAHAQEQDTATRAAARGLGVSGVENYQAGRYEQASDELEKAYGILRVPSLALWSARALVKRGLLVEAAERYLEAASLQAPVGDAAVQKQAIADAKNEATELKPRIPTLRVRVLGAQPSDVVVTIDGKTVPGGLLESPRLVNPGAHEVAATRGSERVIEKVDLSEGQRRELSLRFSADATSAVPKQEPPAPRRAPSDAPTSPPESATQTRRALAIVALAAGGAGLVLGGVAGGLAYRKKAELDDTGKCTDGCPSSLSDDVDQLHLYRPLSTAGFIAGGVLTGLGVVLWVTAPSATGRETRAQVTPNGVLLSGRF